MYCKISGSKTVLRTLYKQIFSKALIFASAYYGIISEQVLCWSLFSKIKYQKNDKKLSFPLRVSSGYVTKSAGKCEVGHI